MGGGPVLQLSVAWPRALVINGQPDEALKLICSHAVFEKLWSFINTVS